MSETSGDNKQKASSSSLPRRGFLAAAGTALAGLGITLFAGDALVDKAKSSVQSDKKDVFTHDTFVDVKAADNTPYDIEMVPGFMYEINNYLEKSGADNIPEDFKCLILFNDDMGSGETETSKGDREAKLDISADTIPPSFKIPVKYWINYWAKPATNMSKDKKVYLDNVRGSISGQIIESIALLAGTPNDKARLARLKYENDLKNKVGIAIPGSDQKRYLKRNCRLHPSINVDEKHTFSKQASLILVSSN